MGHLFVAWVLDKMPAVHGEKLKALILHTRDLSLVKAHVLPLPPSRNKGWPSLATRWTGVYPRSWRD